ncbi:MAG TPA: Asp-tRNA(Asn)/Glu-tRNA(Gln) amidotransferase subunit GatB [Candidatus Paceibacterota bacterium]
MKYIPTIGLEVHAELKTESKMFCSCKNDPLEKQPNVNICPICMGHPGTLPFPNEKAIHQVIKTGLALNCAIAAHSKFDRKNYFYPDLPKGYQISQYDMPLCQKGYLQIGDRKIDITRIHLEEDTGRSQHPPGTDYSLVDFNRAGIPLMELVTEPVIQDAKEASAFAQELQTIFRYLGISDADMEKGQMRVEANVSVRPEGTEKLGTKVEVKNLNSFRTVEDSIEYEIQRQSALLDAGEAVTLETRGWDESKKETFSQRAKEEAHDYRYFPEPDIPPLTFTPEFIEKLRDELPELPQTRKTRMQKEYNLTDKEADLLIKDKELGEYFEQVVSELGPHLSKDELAKRVKLSVNYIVSDLQGMLAGMSVESKDFKITAENFAELMNMIADAKISSPAAKTLLKKMFETGGDPSQLLESEGLAQVSDESQIEQIAKDIIAKNPKAVADYKAGKSNALQFLVGQMMSATRSTVNPETARKIVLAEISKV